MSKKRHFFDTILFFVLLLLAASVPAAGSQPHQDILEAAREHAWASVEGLGDEVQVTALPLDHRLKLALCDLPLETYDSPNGVRPGRSVVGVRCGGSRPWKLYVSVRVEVLQAVIVSRNPLPRGHLMAAEDLSLVQRDTATLRRGYFSDPGQVIGQRTKRHLGAGKVVTPSTLARDQLVRRGSDVQIVAHSGMLQVHMRGEALSNGGLGERIRVRNQSSGRVVSGTVIGPAVIQVTQ